MTLVLPSTVEELNSLQNSFELPRPVNAYVKAANQGFENIAVEKKFKREYSLPNGVENWNINNFDPYLNFEDNVLTNDLEATISRDDRLVPEEGDQRQRCESFSSVSSSNMDDKQFVYHNMGVKTFNTVCVDSGSTCISSDHSYVHPASTIFKGLDAEETYQNLDVFLQQVPDFANDTMSSTVSSISSPGNDSTFDLCSVHSSFSLQEHCHQDVMSEKNIGMKRPIENSPEDEISFLNASKRPCDDTGNETRYHEVRRKNNIASKNCRKTRKEKQKEMEIRVAELEKEKESLRVQVQVLEDLIQAHKTQLYAIFHKR